MKFLINNLYASEIGFLLFFIKRLNLCNLSFFEPIFLLFLINNAMNFF
jgi:hypothetical protein